MGTDKVYEAVKSANDLYFSIRSKGGYPRQELRSELEKCGLPADMAMELSLRLDFWFDDTYAAIARRANGVKENSIHQRDP